MTSRAKGADESSIQKFVDSLKSVVLEHANSQKVKQDQLANFLEDLSGSEAEDDIYRGSTAFPPSTVPGNINYRKYYCE